MEVRRGWPPNDPVKLSGGWCMCQGAGDGAARFKVSESGAERDSDLVLVRDSQHQTLRIASFQNTPAAFHGREHLVEAMTAELSDVPGARHVVDLAL